MSNSPLVSYTRISPNKTVNRNHKIDTITIHCYVGQVGVEDMCSWLSNPKAQASANYCIGVDGRIALNVEEKDRAWTSSSASNDNRAITIECASDKTAPFAINDKVYASLIELCADICKRNDIKELKWKADKSLIGQVDKQNMTVHRWFKNKDCPGEYIYSRLGQIAAEVNAKLGVDTSSNTTNSYPTPPFNIKVLINDLNYRSEPSMNGVVRGQTGKGTFEIVEVNNGWGKLKSGAGWVWLGNPQYCTIHTINNNLNHNTNINTNVPFMVKIDISDLNIRKGPGTNYEKTGSTTGVGSFTIVEVKQGQGSTSGWGRLKSGAGWISLDFTKRI